jgi:hypothetical protein
VRPLGWPRVNPRWPGCRAEAVTLPFVMVSSKACTILCSTAGPLTIHCTSIGTVDFSGAPYLALVRE